MKKSYKKLYFAPIIALFLFSQAYTQEIDRTVTEPGIHPTFKWSILQLIPSPQWSNFSGSGAQFGARWQVTPLLYSWGINKKLSPWRSLVAEPLTRHNGSLELFISPEYTDYPSIYESKWLFRSGLRAYFPLWHFGEYLSASLGSSIYTFDNQQGISFEGGFYMFMGILGFQVTYSPELKEAPLLFTIKLSYF